MLLSIAPFAAVGMAQAVRSGNPDMDTSKVELFGGYSYWRPYKADINNVLYQPITEGAVGSLTVYLNHWLGVRAEGGIHPHGINDCAATAEGGLVVRKTFGHLIPFAQVLGGGVKIGGPVLNPCTWGYGGTGGVGVDYVLHGFGSHLAIRPIQADYQYNYVDYGPLVGPGNYSGGLLKMNTIRLSAGVVLRFGQSSDRQAAQLSCSASPSFAYPGDPVNVSANTLNIDIRKPADYTWTTTGGKLSGKGDAVIVDTTGLAPGEYTVGGAVQQGRGTMGHATCTTSFTIKPYEPPTVACSASPASIRATESATITATGRSPQNRPLTYTFTSTAGQITSAANVATLGTGGVLPGDITVTCSIADDLGKTAMATTVVNISVPSAPPVAPQQRSLCTVAFDNDRRRPARVDNQAKACLDDIALSMQRESDAQLVIVGEHGTDEGSPLASERAVNVRQYLTAEKGIDGSRIQVRTGSTPGHTVESIIVPTGAIFTMEGSEVVDPGMVVRHGQAYGTGRGATTMSTPRKSTRRRTTRRRVSPATPGVSYVPPEGPGPGSR